MKEFRHGNAVVRISGEPDREKLKKATAEYWRKVQQEKQRKERQSEAS